MRGLRIVFICELWETLRARSCESSLISDKLDILDNGFFERSVTGTSISEMVKKSELQDNNVTLYQLVGKIIFLRLFLSASYSCSRFYIFIILFFFQNGIVFSSEATRFERSENRVRVTSILNDQVAFLLRAETV